jgi:hypothetical protein
MVASGGRALALRRTQILAYRRAVQGLDERLAQRPASLRQAAWAGLQDSMPRAALLSLHARVAGTTPSGWEDPSLVQMWGPRFSAYVVPRQDVPIFSLGRFPASPTGIRRAEEMADRLDAFLVGRRMSATDIGRRLGLHPNALRYAAPTGRVLIRWDGARQPTVWTIPAPEMDVADARLELARRYLHFFAPATAGGFAKWAGIKPPMGESAFESLGDAILPVRTPIGEGWILAEDESALRAASTRAGPTRMLPSGDPYFLLQGADRELLVPDAGRRSRLWTSRVWPGAVLVGGEIVGVWRRAGASVTVEPWRRLTRAERTSVEAEAATMPLPGVRGPIAVQWAGSRARS